MRRARAALVLAVLLAAAMPAVAASEVTVAGWAQYGFHVPVNTVDSALHAVHARAYLTYKADDVNTFTLQMFNNDPVIVASIGAAATSTIADNVYIYYAYLTTDLAKFLKIDGIGLGITLINGKLAHTDAGYGNVTQSAWEDTSAAGLGAAWATAGTITYKTFGGLEYAVNPIGNNDFYFGLYTSQTASFGTISAEVAYDGNSGATFGSGIVVADGSFQKTFGDITAKVGTGMNYNIAGAALAWNAGLRVTHSTLGLVSVAVKGVTGTMLNLLIADLAVNAIPNMAILGTVKLDFTPGVDLFNTLDAAVRFDVGVADFYLGYQLGQSSLWAPVVFTTTGTDRTEHSGPYFKVELSY